MNSTCIIIPVYNHRNAIRQTIADIRHLRLPCIAVNDGSTDGSDEILEELAGQYPELTVLHLQRNGGKGTAVLQGLNFAKSKSFTHALLLDADGQHHAGDAIRFLEESEHNPHAVIVGAPRFDLSAPKARLYGREISNVLAWVQTLSMEPRDVLCGYRLLPLDDRSAKVWKTVRGRRMDFDAEILVRLSWAGFRMVNIPTPVTYPKDGVSHFRYLQDNVLIARSHIRLLLGMVMRAPLLMRRMLMRKIR